MAGAGCTVVGLTELERALNLLPDRVCRRVIRSAMSKGARPIVKAAKQKAPVSKKGEKEDSGQKLYRKSIGMKVRTYKHHGVVAVIIGGRMGARFQGHGALSHLLEKGHRTVTGGTAERISGKRKGKTDKARSPERTGKGEVKGFVPAQPHLSLAFDSQKGKSLSLIKTALGEGIEREAAKLAKR